MIEDLADRGQPGDTRDITRHCDVVVIGAGTLGLPTTALLAREAGKRVICLESGGEQQQSETHPLNAIDGASRGYRGAAHGRFRCLGGTSSRWGATLIPFQQADLEGAGWPLGLNELTPHLPAAERFFGLDHSAYDASDLPVALGPTHVARLAKMPSFRHRNVAHLVGDELRQSRRAEVWLNATVIGLDADAGGAGVQVRARAPEGQTLTVSAPRLIIAAGAIETTRLALLLDRGCDGAIRRTSPDLGRFFTDHISLPVADIEPLNGAALNRIVGYRFGASGSMRNLRFELAPQSATRREAPPNFAYVGFEPPRTGGFEALHGLFKSVQIGQLPPARVVGEGLRHLPWLIRAAWWRLAYKRLLYPSGVPLQAYIVAEQRADRRNRISLSETRRDQYGVPLPVLDWRLADADYDGLERAAALLEETWTGSGLARLGRFRRRPVGRATARPADKYHPTGSTRMGRDASCGVVDRDLRLFARPQVQLLATSVLPTGGGANPTLMAFLLALRCVEQHAQAQPHGRKTGAARSAAAR